uniref:T9SS type A sorting domain-containing protein n=1 Tax=Flavobacterium suncheonense TaxID=350894 RepID=UPI0004059218|nr:T9SS type A sorting domain-containing protein [Flavobacterium suncheonense]
MKKITLLIVTFMLGLFGVYAQSASTYVFTSSMGTYTDNSGAATTLAGVRADTFISAAQNIGFTFVYEGVPYTQFKMSSNGFISLNTVGTSSLTTNDFSTANATSRPILAPLWDDLDGSGPATSLASYEVTGSAPNRVLTVEWKNWEWNYSSTSAVISFQVKLYETTNEIEFVYRQEATAVASGSASIGIGSATGSGSGSYLNLTSVTAPAVSSTASTTNINTKPATGQIFKFTPPPVCTGTPVAGTATPANQTLVTGYTPAVLTVSGQSTGVSGLTYQWEQSTDGGSNWVNAIGGTGATTLSYTPPAFSGTPILYRLNITCTASSENAYSSVASLTPCGVETAPTATETFATYLPTCWSVKKGALTASSTLTGTTSEWMAEAGFGNAGSNAAVRINLYGGSVATPDNDWIISNSIDLGPTPSLYRIKYKIGATTYLGSTVQTTLGTHVVRVVVSTDNGATWSNANVIKTYTGAGTYTVGQEETVNLIGYSGVVKIGFLATTTSTSPDIDFHIDDFQVELMPACSAPTALGAGNFTNNSASLYWTAGGTESAWNIEWGPTGFTQGTGTVVNGVANPYLLSGLAASTTYQYYVQADCTANGTSTWAGPYSFTTTCAPASIPYTQNFESATVPNLPSCTSQVNLGSGNSWTVENNPGYGFTTKTLRYRWNTTSPANVWFFTQGVNLTAGQEYKISYNYGNAGTTFPEKLKVAYGTSNSPAAMVNTLADYPNINQATIQSDLIVFTPAADGVYYFGFQAYSAADQFYLFVDNIVVDVNLGTSAFDASSFKAFPNPVTNVLNLSYSSEISSVEVFNMLGQKVLVKELNVAQGQIDMSNLNAGNYLVKVTADGQTKTIKVIKQ